MELWPGARCTWISGFCVEMWLWVVGGWGWHVDFDAHSDDFLAGLCEKGTLLPLEEATGWAGSHLGEAGGRCGGKEGHELMAGGWSRVLSRGRVGVLCEIDVWGRSAGMMAGEEGSHLAASSGRVDASSLKGGCGRRRLWWRWKRRRGRGSGQ